MNTYTEFQNENASEKILFALCNSKKRLVGWSVHSGSIYKIQSQSFDKIEKIEDSGSDYTEVFDVSSVTASKYYYDRDNGIVYLRATDSANPNSRFIVATITWYFSNFPIKINNDLSTGYSVYCRPIIKSASKFGVELDNQDQIGLAIEGSGTISFHNELDFWVSRYDNYTWENQAVKIYSWNNRLPITEAKLIFRGKINGKSYSSSVIQFKLKDLIVDIRQPYLCADIQDLAVYSVPSNLLMAKQRRVYGKVNGFMPTNIDQLDSSIGMALTGTVSITSGSATLTGSGTNFIGEVSKNDTLILSGVDYSVETVDSDTQITLSQEYESTDLSAATIYIKPNEPKAYLNRIWKVAGHELNQPSTTINTGISQNRFEVNDITDFFVGDDIYVGSLGSGEVAQIANISGHIIVTSTNLLTVPTPGVSVFRPAVQNVRINDLRLKYERDYALDASTGVLTLTADAEFNVGLVRTLSGQVTFNGTSAVTGSGTIFTKQLVEGQWISLKTQNVWHRVLAIIDDTNLTLETNASSGTDDCWYKSNHYFKEGSDKLTCTVYGTTDDDTASGNLLKTGPEIIKHILENHGLSGYINTVSFQRAKEAAPHLLGLAIPETFSETKTKSLRDIIQKINFSIFSSVVQNEDFEIECNILQPMRPTDIKTFRNYDILSFSIDTEMDRCVKSVNIIYNSKEYDYLTSTKSNSTSTKTSDVAQYLVETITEKFIETALINQDDARIFASRWVFLLEHGSTAIKFNTKLQASRLQVTDKVEIIHDKFYDRIGGGQQKVAAINSIKKDAFGCEVEIEDLGNAYTRVCLITDSLAPVYSASTQTEKYSNGFITDQYGLINNDETTHGLNLLW